jgi:anti-sigma regulatory factor (Ser/Thr protein kinase)
MLRARYQITESSQRGEARRAAAAQAQSLGFDEETVGRIALVVSELAGNLVAHVPGGGQLLLRSVQRGDFVSIEVVAIDRGPGLGNHQQALRDGFSLPGHLEPGSARLAGCRINSICTRRRASGP